MDDLFLGIPGVDIPYPKYVQDALDFIERETKRQRSISYDSYTGKIHHKEPTRIVSHSDERFWETRRVQKAAQQKKRPYQQVDNADQWPSW